MCHMRKRVMFLWVLFFLNKGRQCLVYNPPLLSAATVWVGSWRPLSHASAGHLEQAYYAPWHFFLHFRASCFYVPFLTSHLLSKKTATFPTSLQMLRHSVTLMRLFVTFSTFSLVIGCDVAYEILPHLSLTVLCEFMATDLNSVVSDGMTK